MVSPFKNIDFNFSKERTTLLICIGLSFLIWFFLKLSKEYETDKQICLEYSLPPMMEFTQPPPSNLVATVRGTGGELLKKFLLRRNLSIVIDLSQLQGTVIQSSDLIWKIQEQTGLSVKNINRNLLEFFIDSTVTKKVPVELNIDLVFEKDFFEKEPMKWSPDSVVLAGPLQELKEVNRVETEKTKIGPVNGDATLKLKIDKTSFKNLTVQPENINIEIFSEQYTEKSFEVPITVINAPADFQISPTTATVSFTVGLSNYENLQKDSFIVEVDLGQAIKLGPEKSVPLNLKGSPAWIKSPRVSPKVVDYVIIQ
ncbi:MAG: hypothetical protein R2788_10945 [Saprospiraceae bacterium]